MKPMSKPLMLDCFLYNGEADLLEWRYEILKERVDFFIAVQGTLTFTGRPKPVYPVPDSIHSAVINSFPEASPRNAWKREMFQRNQILSVLGPELAPETLVMVSDVDEIPDPRDIPASLEYGELIRFQHEFYHFNFNNHVIQDDSARKGWSCAALCRLDNLYKWYPQGIRNLPATKIIPSGWHFSWFWKPNEKALAYSHVELNEMEGELPQRIQQRWDYRYEYIPGMAHLPRFLQDTAARWSHYFHEGVS